ncbi:hypothetical protein OG413_28140 [Streptomyces sp. NBC_01433]|uniref:hypothetical protein n=1 Tax=Streptomyces sp. NBC_01433 TaxID=2903864 RepID=UPI00225AA236|nr:hypothetical protein [Streptomyces sp. NBC_01433]MCX4679129.1 hypothetical protein [Streptomyces sp. NBC_01433]
MTAFGRALAAAGIAAALCAGFPLSAQGAMGTFTYKTCGNVRTLSNPAGGRCYAVGNASGEVKNSANRDASLYAGRACHGDIVRTVSADDTEEVGAFASVQFDS